MTFVESLRRRGVPFRILPNREVAICCPFCTERGESPDTRFRLNIDPSDKLAFCFNCGWKSRETALERIAQKLNLLAFEGEKAVEKQPPQYTPELPEDFQVLTKTHADLDAVARRYLLNRGITADQIRQYRIGVSFMGRYRYRVIFPVLRDKKLTGFVARDFTGTREPKYLNSLGAKSLYTPPRFEPVPIVVISEGVFKALRIAQILPRDAMSLASLGRVLTDGQIEQLQELRPERIVLWPDPDRAGRSGVIDSAERLRAVGFPISIVWPVLKPADDETTQQLRDSWRALKPEGGWRLLKSLKLRHYERDGG